MHRSAAIARPRSVCHICNSISAQRRQAAKSLIPTRNIARLLYQSRRSTSSLAASQSRPLSSAVLPTGSRVTAKSRTGDDARVELDDAATPTSRAPGFRPSSIADIVNHFKTSELKLFTSRGIPSEQNVSAALEDCHILANWFTDEATQPQNAHAISELESTTSTLLSLDGAKTTRSSKSHEGLDYPTLLREMINEISETAYMIITYPPVFITPSLLKQYVKVQAKLGKPETLPEVFQLYASKPVPREGSMPVTYTRPNPNRAANAIEPEVIDAALDTAIEARNLDAAVGIIENSYGTKAFVRSKLLRHGLVPLGTFAVTPIAAYILASNFSGLQQTMDSATATNVAFAGIIAYVGFTASIGMVALTTANDQMKRVTWAPGVPLRKRWIREEERAALDKLACAWGFQEPWRQGEEEGADWDALREYIGQKGMMLDRTELMEGMD
ncbi:hypothetical protein F5Y19DRAFT_482182 [Xylariaceae sp. FL1651]|nr:hypothetical protein F5Y19DRAFT_482182 [Xylariaceae sp. FL1651]